MLCIACERIGFVCVIILPQRGRKIKRGKRNRINSPIGKQGEGEVICDLPPKPKRGLSNPTDELAERINTPAQSTRRMCLFSDPPCRTKQACFRNALNPRPPLYIIEGTLNQSQIINPRIQIRIVHRKRGRICIDSFVWYWWF